MAWGIANTDPEYKNPSISINSNSLYLPQTPPGTQGFVLRGVGGGAKQKEEARSPRIMGNESKCGLGGPLGDEQGGPARWRVFRVLAG